MDRDEIVPSSAYGKRSREVGRLKIRDEKYDCSPRYDVV